MREMLIPIRIPMKSTWRVLFLSIIVKQNVTKAVRVKNGLKSFLYIVVFPFNLHIFLYFNNNSNRKSNF